MSAISSPVAENIQNGNSRNEDVLPDKLDLLPNRLTSLVARLNEAWGLLFDTSPDTQRAAHFHASTTPHISTGAVYAAAENGPVPSEN